MKKKWTDEEVELLKQYYHQGLSMREIGEKINRTRGSVEGKIWLLKMYKQME